MQLPLVSVSLVLSQETESLLLLGWKPSGCLSHVPKVHFLEFPGKVGTQIVPRTDSPQGLRHFCLESKPAVVRSQPNTHQRSPFFRWSTAGSPQRVFPLDRDS
jgi:hypothetical protein